MSDFDSSEKDFAGDWLAEIDPGARDHIRDAMRGVTTEDFETAPASSIIPQPTSIPAAEQTLSAESEPDIEPIPNQQFWAPATWMDRIADSISDHPIKNSISIACVAAVTAGITGLGIGFAKGESQATTEHPIKPAQLTASNAIDVLLTHSSLMEGFVCPAQLDAEGDLISGQNFARSRFYHDAANLMLSQLDPKKLARECPPDLSNLVSPSSPSSIVVATNLGSRTVRLVDVLPDLIP